MKVKQLTAVTLILSLGIGTGTASAQERRPVVNHAEIDQVLAVKTEADEGARASIRTLLGRAEVRAMADEMGLDLRRAESAVSTLEGRALARVANQAAAANDLLVGGQDFRISLVAILLIIIIVILLVD